MLIYMEGFNKIGREFRISASCAGFLKHQLKFLEATKSEFY